MQLILILTKAVEKCFTKNSKFDMRPLLGGTEVVFSSLIHTFNWYGALINLAKALGSLLLVGYEMKVPPAIYL